MKKIAILTTMIFTLVNITLGNTGKISGKVTDKKTSEPLIGVSVFIENIKTGAMTDIEGRFTINNVEEGKYSITASYVGYKTQIVREVEVKAKDMASVNLFLEESSNELAEATIVASVDKNTVTNILLMQQKNVSITSGISQDEIKRTPDKSVNEVVKRMSSTSIQDNKFIIIRGLSDRYNSGLINDMPLPSTEPDRKAFSFDVFPSNMLDNIVVFKTASPELPGDFAGGVIQLNTRDIPDKGFFSITTGTGLNSQSAFKPYDTYDGGKKDWIGMDDGTRGLPRVFADQKNTQQVLSTDATKYDASKEMTNDWGLSTMKSSPINRNFQLATGTNFKVLKNPFGIMGSLTYNNSRKTTFIERADFNIDTTKIFKYGDTQYKENVLWGGMLNISYKIKEHSKISFKNMFSVNGEDMVTMREGIDYGTQQNIKASAMQFTSNQLASCQFNAEHFFSKSKIKIRWGSSFNEIKRDMPNVRRMYYAENFGDTTYYAYVPLSGSPSPNYAGKFYSSLTEKSYAVKADVTVPFKLFKQNNSVKIGGLYQSKERGFTARSFGYVVSKVSQFDWNLLTYGQDSIFNAENIGPQGFTFKELINPSNSYTAGSDLHAGYMMFDQSFGKKLRLVWGARIENYNQHLNSLTYGGDTVAVDTTYMDILPSLNFTYSVTELSNIRFSASRTVARPEFRELAPFAYYDFNTASAVYGNDTLTRTNITNVDMKYEIFPGFKQMFSAGLFYKNFTNPIEQIIDASSGAGSRTFTYQNALGAVNYGAEIEWRMKLNVLDSLFHWKWKQLDNFTLFSNLALIRSKVDLSNVKSAVTENEKKRALQGQSPYIANCGLQYVETKRGIGVSLLFNRIGRRIAQVGSNGFLSIYEAPRSVFDIQVSKKFLKQKNLEIKFNASDILNNQSVFYQDQNASGKFEDGSDTKFTGIKLGVNYSVSLSWKF